MAENADDFVDRLLSGDGEKPRSQAETMERYRAPSPNVHNERPPRSPLPPALQKAGEYILDFNRVALDEAAFGTTRPINTALFGTAYSALDLISGYKGDTGDKSPIGVIQEAFGRAYNETDTAIDDSIENLGTGGTLMASLLGNIAPFSAAGKFDKAIDGGVSLVNQISKGGKWARTGRAALAGGTTAALQGYFQGNTSFEDLMLSGGFGAGMGGLVYRLAGERALPLIMNMRNAEGKLISAIADTGPNASGNLNIRSIAQAVDDNKFTNRSWLTAEIGNSPNYRQWEKLNDAMADYSFKGIEPGKVDAEAVRQAEETFVRAHDAVNSAITTVNREARDTFRMALGSPEGRRAALYDNNQSLRSAREAYRLMTSTTGQNALGKQPFSPQEIIDMGDTALLNDIGRDDIKDISPPMFKMRNALKDLLRGREVQKVAGDVQNIPSQGVGSDRADEIIPEELPLFRLIDARTGLSELLSPAMAFQNGLKRSELKAGKILLDQIDEYLDIRTNDGFGLARGAFAKGMKVEEAFDLGSRVYTERSIEVKDKNAFNEFYGDYVSEMVSSIEDKDVLEAFRTGFKQAMFDQTGRRGFLEEMQYFIGPADTAGETFFKGKGENYRLMEQILGEDDTRTIMELYRDGAHQERVMALFRDNLQAAGFDEDAAFELSNTLKGSNAYTIDTADPSFLIRAARSVMRKVLKPSDRKMGEAALDLMMAEGDDLTNMIARGTRSAVGGVPMSIGARAGGTLNYDTFFETEGERTERWQDATQEEQNIQELEEYFKELGISPN